MQRGLGSVQPEGGDAKGADKSRFRAERSCIGQRRAGLWGKRPFRCLLPPTARPPAKMSDMEDDFMCDDEEDYDLVRRSGPAVRSGALAGALPLSAGAGVGSMRPSPLQQQQPRRVLPRGRAMKG